jgi:rSAM/selenodomain-associated transferase 1
LAQAIGNEKAAELYSAMARTVINNISKSGDYNRIIFFDPPERKLDVKKWLSKSLNRAANGKGKKTQDYFSLFPQQGDSLGQRMASAFDTVFSLGAEKAVIIGTDCIDISEEIIFEAFDSLKRNDAVLGPAQDGGYYLLGLTKPNPEIFHNIDWGTNVVFAQTLEKIKEKRLHFELLKTLGDVDQVDDLCDELLLTLGIEKGENG